MLPADRSLLGKDGDAPLALLIVGVHHSIDGFTARRHRTSRLEHRIDEGGFAVVDVSDDGDIA